jgi:hypothetical protein
MVAGNGWVRNIPWNESGNTSARRIAHSRAISGCRGMKPPLDSEAKVIYSMLKGLATRYRQSLRVRLQIQMNLEVELGPTFPD